MRQGPHQGAHRSTRTGTVDVSTAFMKVSSPASVVQGSGVLQLAQRGVPGPATAGTRFLRPHCGHDTMLADSALADTLTASWAARMGVVDPPPAWTIRRAMGPGQIHMACRTPANFATMA